jgi:3-dehydroquinate dehydratase-2
MTKFLVLHGAGMELRGKTQAAIDQWGPDTLDDYDRKIGAYADELGVEVETFHSNVEGDLVNELHEANRADFDAAIINPAGYTRGYPALVAAIAEMRFPVIEVHLSNPTSRGGASEIGPPSKGLLYGFGVFGYYLAMRGLLDAASA